MIQRGIVEPQIGDLVELAGYGAVILRDESIQAFEGFPRRLALLCVWVLVHILPVGRLVRPHEQSEPLYKAVVTLAAGVDSADVFRDPSRLRGPEHRNADRRKANVPANDPVESIGLGSIPPRQVEAAGARLILAIEGKP